jgi:hypothetical protein
MDEVAARVAPQVRRGEDEEHFDDMCCLLRSTIRKNIPTIRLHFFHDSHFERRVFAAPFRLSLSIHVSLHGCLCPWTRGVHFQLLLTQVMRRLFLIPTSLSRSGWEWRIGDLIYLFFSCLELLFDGFNGVKWAALIIPGFRIFHGALVSLG